MIKYAVYPGLITSPSDGDTHFISAGQLMELHRVNQKECIVMRRNEPRSRGIAKDLICLFPRGDGNYHHYN